MNKLIPLIFLIFFISACTPSDYVLVKSGSFMMGTSSEEERNPAYPAHRVTLDYDYFIACTEVTVSMYGEMNGSTESYSVERSDHPVTNISWWQAVAYCNWMSETAGFSPAYDENGNLLDGNGNITTDITQVEGFRLPTEAEWEYAARGGYLEKDTLYSGSDDVDSVSWYKGNSGDDTHPVGTKNANELGIFDMSGNVVEWCHDRHALYTQDELINPIGASSGERRVVRGGSYFGDAKYGKVYERGASAPQQSMYYFGFRLARTAID